MAAERVAQQRPQVLGELVHERVAAVLAGRESGDHRSLERDRARGPLGERGALIALAADHREPLGEPPALRPLGLEQRPQRHQVIGQRLERREPLASHLEPGERPGELAAFGRRRVTRLVNARSSSSWSPRISVSSLGRPLPPNGTGRQGPVSVRVHASGPSA